MIVNNRKHTEMQECKTCHRMDDRNYKLQCGHEFCLDCVWFKVEGIEEPCCNTCNQSITMGDLHAIWRKTHCTHCDHWISGSYGRLCENCYFESDEFAEKVARAKEWEDAFSETEG